MLKDIQVIKSSEINLQQPKIKEKHLLEQFYNTEKLY
jgi:hypothetical protein